MPYTCRIEGRVFARENGLLNHLIRCHGGSRSKMYPNRLEAIRIAVRDLLKSELWEKPKDGE